MGESFSSDMKKKQVLIFQSGEPIPSDSHKKRKMRAWNLIDELLLANFEVNLISARFDHLTKTHREKSFYNNYHDNLKIHLISSPGYKNNISFSRLFDHLILAFNLIFFLRKSNFKPDAVFIGYPPIEAGFILMLWAKKNKIKTILDVKDLWPHIFLQNLTSIKLTFAKALLFPYFYMYRFLVRNAFSVISISESFLSFIYSDALREKQNNDTVIYLTSPSSPSVTRNKDKDTDKKTLSIGFVGSFMHAFDFDHIANNISQINNIGDIRFIFAGNGSQFQHARVLFKDYKNVVLPGWISGHDLDDFYQEIDLTIIPLKNRMDFQMSFPNKAIDSLSRGKPIITSCIGDLSKFLESHKCGFSYDMNEINSLYKVLYYCYKHPEIISEMSINAKSSYLANFDHQTNYLKLINLIQQIV